MIRLLVTDLDHTLLNDSKTIDAADRAALERLQEGGIGLAVASGRSDPEIQSVLTSLKQPFHRISQNGAFVRTNKGDILHSSSFPTETAQEILRLSASSPLLTFVTAGETTYTPFLTQEARDYIQRMELPNIKETPDLSERLDEYPSPCKVAFIGDMDDILALRQSLERHPSIREETDSFISSPYCMDIVPKHTSKGQGIQHLMDELGLQAEEIATIGDSDNDIPMLELTPHSFAMAHAEPQVKTKAKHVVSSVAQAIDQLLHKNAETEKTPK